MTALGWIMASIAFVGVWLNVRGDRRCFLLWAVTNAGNAIYAASKGAYPLAVLFAAYWLLAIWGLWRWRTRPLKFR